MAFVGYEGPRRSLLVVDDKPSNRSILVNLLRPLGFDLYEAADGRQAVEKATAIRPDAIFMDLLHAGDGRIGCRPITSVRCPNSMMPNPSY